MKCNKCSAQAEERPLLFSTFMWCPNCKDDVEKINSSVSFIKGAEMEFRKGYQMQQCLVSTAPLPSAPTISEMETFLKKHWDFVDYFFYTDTFRVKDVATNFSAEFSVPEVTEQMKKHGVIK